MSDKPSEPGSIRILQPGETYTPMSGKYSRPPFTDPQPRRCDRCGRAWMCFWLMVFWILALLAAIIWGANP